MVQLLLDVNGEIAEPGGDEDLAQQVRAFNALSRAKELTSQVRGTLYGVAQGDGFAFRGFQDFSNLLAQEQAGLGGSRPTPTRPSAACSPTPSRASRPDRQPDRAERPGRAGPATWTINAQQWLASTTTEIETLRTVESQLLAGVTEVSQDLATTAQRDALRDAILIAVILAVALLALLLVARSMAQPLQRLRAGAMEIAERRLPDAVQRLRTTETGDLDVRVEPSASSPRTRSARSPRRSTPSRRWPSGSPPSRRPCAAPSATCSPTWPAAPRP